MRTVFGWVFFVFAALVVCAVEASADIACYEYDGEGRLQEVVRDDGSQLIYSFVDDATSTVDLNDNREEITQSTGATATCSTPSGAGGIQSNGGTSSNSPPVVTGENSSFNCGQQKTIDVLANDYDPNFHNIGITDITGSGLGSATYTNGGSTVTYTAPSGLAEPGHDTVDYDVSDGHGGVTVGTLTIYISPCGP